MITIDIHEPELGRVLIGQSIPVEVVSLVDTGWGDYRWKDCNGNYVHAERKQWGEILSGMNHVEEQLLVGPLGAITRLSKLGDRGCVDKVSKVGAYPVQLRADLLGVHGSLQVVESS